MSRTQTSSPSALPTDHPAGFVASLFRSTACIREAFRQQESGELQYFENCWSDAAILEFILIGWVGLVLKVLLFVLLATFLGACVQGRRPWYVFVGFVKGVGKVVGGVCGLFEVEDEVRVSETEAEAGKGVGIARREQKGFGGYFGSSKQKVSSLGFEWNLNVMLTMTKGMIGRENIGRDLAFGRQCCSGVILRNFMETEVGDDGQELINTTVKRYILLCNACL